MWRDETYVLDMLLAARKVLEFTEEVHWERFSRDELIQNAVMRQIQIIGEAARSVSSDNFLAILATTPGPVVGAASRRSHNSAQARNPFTTQPLL